MTQLEQIKAEIKRKLSAHDKVDNLESFEVGKAWNRGHRNALEHLLSFIESLEKENHTKSNELFDKCVANCDPATMKEVSDNVDKLLQEPQGLGEAAEDSWAIYEIGEDPNRAGLVGTPDRVARMYCELFRGYDPAQYPKITTFENGQDGIVYDSMITDSGKFYSLCEHHIMPFFGRYVFAYIPNPNGKILGLSKIGRLIDYHSARLQIQERLVSDIVTDIAEILGTEYPPLGIALYMEGEHLCKTMRGPKKEGRMSCAYLTGIFKEDDQARQEFYATTRELFK